MIEALVILAALVLRGDFPPVVDAVEINTVDDRFTQIIAWGDRRTVRQWWMLPERFDVYEVGEWTFLSWTDEGEVRRMKTRRFVVTWTKHDPEEANRCRLPVERRRAVWRRN